jgi:tRNA(Ile)-lysidine synthase
MGTRASFGPTWLAEQLALLAPGFPHTPLCVAFSGGVDSTALLAALAKARQPATALRALHVDHGLHPASRRWSAHCRAVAAGFKVPLEVLPAEVSRTRGASLEAAARTARYERLAARLADGEVLVTAHHLDDQLETVLLQLLRGAGVAGLAAMPAVAAFGRGWLVRPLLPCSRAELEAWARAERLTWVEDETNLDEHLDRNYLRRRVLPLIRARWPGAALAVARSARHAAEGQELLDALARMDVERASHGRSLAVKTLRTLPIERRRNALRFWIDRCGQLAPDTSRLDEIAGPLIDARPDANPRVAWGSTVVRREADRVSIGNLLAASREETPWAWGQSLSCPLPDGSGKLELTPDGRGPLDLAALPELLTVRWRRGGERLVVRPGGPRRALKSLLQEARVPLADRQRLPLIFAGARLVAVADLWLDASVQAAAGAAARARLSWKRGSP